MASLETSPPADFSQFQTEDTASVNDDLSDFGWDPFEYMEHYQELQPFEDETVVRYQRQQSEKVIASCLMPQDFVRLAFRMPNHNSKSGFERFSFDGRRHLKAIYNTPAKRVLLCCARQTEKSTTLGNKALCSCCLVPSYRVLYVSPSAMQTKTFSVDRIKEPIETSSVLKSFTTTLLSQNVFEKQFVNRSKIVLRYAFLNADRTRGIASNSLFIDELQDILNDNISVIEQCVSHSAEELKKYIYSGTPKSLDNTIEYYRSRLSSQCEWAVPCDCQGGEGGRYWNILGERNIGRKGPICSRCGKGLQPQGEEATWVRGVRFNPETMFEGFRVNQLMVPWRLADWSDIIYAYEKDPRNKFYNEVLGISYDSGLRPLTSGQVQNACSERVTMTPKEVDRYRAVGYSQPIFMGVDYGVGERSFTVIHLATYVENKYRIFFIHRCVGELNDPEQQIEFMAELVRQFNVSVVGADYGMGQDRNDMLIRRFGTQRILKFQYIARPKKKVEWDGKLGRFKVHRTEIMSDVFNAIKRGQIEFPRWEEFRDPFAYDMLNIFSEYNETLRMVQYQHAPDKTDDTFHSLVFGLLASMTRVPRPDIIKPTYQVDPFQPQFAAGYTVVNQG